MSNDKQAPMKVRVFAGIKTTASVDKWPFPVSASATKVKAEPSKTLLRASPKVTERPAPKMSRRDRVLSQTLADFLSED